jgi:NADPH2:quinone reductase
MRAQELQSLTGPTGLKLVEVEAPRQDGRVRIEVRTAGVTFPDLLHTYGTYQERPELPFIPGSEVAGVVSAAPPETGLKPGDRVAALSHLGGWADEVLVDPGFAFPLPDELDFDAAVALVVNYQTAYFSLHDRGRLAPGETVLVHGAAGGLGSAAIQVARGLGARVIALVSSEDKARVAAAAGAERIAVAQPDSRTALEELTGPDGADVVFDVVGGQERFLNSLRSLRPGGRAVVAGFAGGEIPQVRVNRLLLTNTEIVGSAWGAHLRSDPGAARRAHNAILEMGSDVIAPHIGRRFSLGEAPEALRLLESRKALGKTILEL